MSDYALAQAAQMDREQKMGKFRGPLHGVPIALKDNIDTAGIRTTAASKVYDDRVPTEDAEVVRRLGAAGAVFIGKANLDEFADAVSYFGSVRNPWALDRDPSGSSSGSAAAVATTLAYGALGTDTGGSVRLPAAYCGVVGIKPTYGLVPIRGIVPLAVSLDHCGPITRTVRDAALMLNQMAGYDRLDITSVQHPKEDYVAALSQPVSGLRLGIPRAPFFDQVDAETLQAVESAIAVLSKMTKGTRDVSLPSHSAYTWLHLNSIAISIPCGFSRDGLPVGLMIAGPHFSEGKIMALARAYELETKWDMHRPPLRPDTPVPPIRS